MIRQKGKGFVVPISDRIREWAERLAFVRLDRKRRPNRANKSFSTDLEMHRFGCLGEFAFEELTGLFVDTRSYTEGDDGIDFRDPVSGVTYQLRTSSYEGENVHYKVPCLEYQRTTTHADIFVLARAERRPTEVEFLGVIRSDVFDKVKRLEQYRDDKTPNYVVGRESLVPVEHYCPIWWDQWPGSRRTGT